jgi:hypothetical protein
LKVQVRAAETDVARSERLSSKLPNDYVWINTLNLSAMDIDVNNVAIQGAKPVRK